MTLHLSDSIIFICYIGLVCIHLFLFFIYLNIIFIIISIIYIYILFYFYLNDKIDHF